jgi:predicted CXXCH cytochrome family protein
VQSRLKVGASALARALAPATLALALPWTLGLGGCAPRLAARSSSQVGQARRAGEATTVSSNVLRSDYAGSAACAPCHGDIVAAWRRSPMHRMTRLPDGHEGSEVRAPFDGHVFAFRGDTATLETEQGTGTRFMRLRSGEAPGTGTPTERLYRVTKIIGGRYREDFAGVEVASTEPGAAVLGDPRAELILPVSYVFQTASFRLKGYSVLVGERPRLRAGGVWNQTCIFCHNTVPYFDDLWGALYGAGAPGYQGEVVDRLLPPGRRARYAVTSEAGVMQALDAELVVLGARPGSRGEEADDASAASSRADGGDGGEKLRADYRRAILAAKARFTPTHFIEVGVGCEACHGGSREHVDDPGRHPSFAPVAGFLSVTSGSDGAGSGAAGDGDAPSVTSAEWQNRACARCHQVLFSRYPRAWEGGLRREPATAGGSSITSGEGRDFLLGGCARAMACTTCHDPHGEDARARLAQLATPAGNGVCTTCHGALSSPAALAAHAHHDPAGAGGACVACHMPRKNMGLGYALTRYHRIGSPTDPDRVEHDRPLECALCHADKTVGTVLDDIARLWGKRYDPDAIVRLYGSREANVLTATIARGYPHEQAAAMGSAGEQRFRPARGLIERAQVSHAFPLVRYFAAAALAAIDGVPVSVGAVDASLTEAPARSPPAHEGNDDEQD